MLPVECLGDERHDRRPPTAEQEGVYRTPGRVLPLLGDAWALRGRRRKSRVRVRSRLVRLGRPVVALPVDRMLRRLTGHALPPDVAVVGQGAVGEDRVLLDRLHGVRVGLVTGAGCDAEEACLGVDGVKPPVGAELHPGDVVAHSLDGPALELRDQHRQIRLARGRREGPVDVLDLALWRGQLDDQHVLRQPALVAGHHRGNPEREALLTEQRVPATNSTRRTRSRGSPGSGRCTSSRCRARRRPRGPLRAACRPSGRRGRTRRPPRGPRGPPRPCGS